MITKQKHNGTLRKSTSAEIKTLVEVYCINLSTSSVLQITAEIYAKGGRFRIVRGGLNRNAINGMQATLDID